jgi:hypothetical protein
MKRAAVPGSLLAYSGRLLITGGLPSAALAEVRDARQKTKGDLARSVLRNTGFG